LHETQSKTFLFQIVSNNLCSKYRKSALSNDPSTIIFTLQSQDQVKHTHHSYYLCWKKRWFICSRSIAWNVNCINNL